MLSLTARQSLVKDMVRKLFLKVLTACLISLSIAGCGYNTLQNQDETIKSSWAEVVNQYQRRSDLVPNLVNTVKGYAAHEKEVLEAVTEARSKVGAIAVTPELVNDEAAFAKFQAAQKDMTSALSRLIAISENYPQLKASHFPKSTNDIQNEISDRPVVL